MPITITITQGTSSIGLLLKEELVELYDLDVNRVREHIKSRLSSTLFSSSITAQMIQSNIEEID